VTPRAESERRIEKIRGKREGERGGERERERETENNINRKLKGGNLENN